MPSVILGLATRRIQENGNKSLHAAAGLKDSGRWVSLAKQRSNGTGRRKNIWFRRGWEVPQSGGSWLPSVIGGAGLRQRAAARSCSIGGVLLMMLTPPRSAGRPLGEQQHRNERWWCGAAPRKAAPRAASPEAVPSKHHGGSSSLSASPSF